MKIGRNTKTWDDELPKGSVSLSGKWHHQGLGVYMAKPTICQTSFHPDVEKYLQEKKKRVDVL